MGVFSRFTSRLYISAINIDADMDYYNDKFTIIHLISLIHEITIRQDQSNQFDPNGQKNDTINRSPTRLLYSTETQ